MGASKTAICQRALARLGCTTNLSDVDNDTSQEARLCRIFYLDMLKCCLEACDWPFAKVTAAQLALVETALKGNWLSHYAYPQDAIKVLAIYPSDQSNALPYPQSMYSYASDYAGDFEIVDGTNGKYIASFYNVSLLADYIKFEDNTQKFPPSFEDALVYRMAAELALGLNKSLDLSGKMMNAYLSILAVSKASQKNENQFKSVSRMIRDRSL